MIAPRLLSICAGRIALTISEAQNALGCSYEAVVLAIPAGWITRMGFGTIPVAAVAELARKLGVPCND